MKRVAALAVLAVCPLVAFAQQSMTVGELLGKGGKKLSGEVTCPPEIVRC